MNPSPAIIAVDHPKVVAVPTYPGIVSPHPGRFSTYPGLPGHGLPGRGLPGRGLPGRGRPGRGPSEFATFMLWLSKFIFSLQN